MFYPIKFEPVYKDYLWGGENLKKLNKKNLLPVTAESWEISANKDGMGIIANGKYQGRTLESLFLENGKEICGDRGFKQFPLLIKLIDACSDLSVQVHPDDKYAFEHENGGSGKNEMWYVVDAKEDAQLVYGLKKGVTKSDFIEAIVKGTVQETLNFVPVKKGDWFNIPSGLVHAIGAGIIIMEVQQNSNTTYRVYDYDRVGSDGNKRPLHIEKALDVIDFSNNEIQKNKINVMNGRDYLVYNKYFAVQYIERKESYTSDTHNKSFHAYTVISGEMAVAGVEVPLGASVLIPADMGRYTLLGEFKAIKSFVPVI
jgi:mannose-6-phosphate isomerase